MANVFELAQHCLTAPRLSQKLAVTRQAQALFDVGELQFQDEEPPLPVEAVVWPQILRFVDPKALPRRSVASKEGRIALLHAVAHIEFSAILLHWDGLYRFRGMPEEYYRDWLRVVLEELRHFELLRRRLRQLGADYGQLPVHDGLWRVARDTHDDVLARMALVPRCMEARGLDVTPGMVASFRRVGDRASADILETILADEVGHVALGSFWFRFLCQVRGLDSEPTYRRLVWNYLRHLPRGPFNLELRRLAGFGADELAQMESSK